MRLFRSIPMRSYSLVGASAGLQVLIFPTGGPMNPSRAWLAWIAFIPLLFAILCPNREGRVLKIRHATFLGYLCGVLWYLGNCFWIYQTMYLYGGLPKLVSWFILVLFAFYLGLYHALFAALLAWMRNGAVRPTYALVLTPFMWVTVELARSRVTGFPWDLLGNSQVDNAWLTRIAPLAGVMAISFVVVAGNAILTASFLFKGATKVWLRCAGVLIATVSIVSGRVLEHRQAPMLQTTATAVLMQENLLVGATGQAVRALTPSEELSSFRWATMHPESALAPASLPDVSPTVLVWPEAPSHFRSDDADFRNAIGDMARSIRAPAIIGSLGVDFTQHSARGYYEYDSATWFDEMGKYRGRYDKIHLVPWGEYVPFKQLFFFAEKLTEGVGNMDPGTSRIVFSDGGHRYGVFICYESIFGNEVREFALNGAEVLVNISDDGWYGETGAPWQHLNMARMRAIENHRWVLRSTNTGVTTAIDPRGRITGEAPRHVRGAYVFPFSFIKGTTFYTRHGDWFAWLCVLICALAGGRNAWKVISYSVSVRT